MNRYRKLDMTVGEKEMVIAELQAKYVSMIMREKCHNLIFRPPASNDAPHFKLLFSFIK